MTAKRAKRRKTDERRCGDRGNACDRWRNEQRKWTIDRYAAEAYWPDKEGNAAATLLDIRSTLENDVLPYWRGTTLAAIEAVGEGRVGDYREWLGQLKTRFRQVQLKAAVAVNSAWRLNAQNATSYVSCSRQETWPD